MGVGAPENAVLAAAALAGRQGGFEGDAPEALAQVCGQPASAPALVRVDGSVICSYGRLLEAAEGLARELTAASVLPGDVVAALLPNGAPFAAALLGTWMAGAVFAPVDPRLTPTEVGRVFDVARPAALLADRRASFPTGEVPTATFDDAVDPRRRDWLNVGPAPRDDMDDPLLTAADALLLFTSGSTGRPKGVVLTRQNLAAGVRAVRRTFELTPDDRTAAVLPWTHGHGLLGVLVASLTSGGQVAVPGGRGPAILEALEASATWLSVVPPLLTFACDAQEGSPQLARLRFVRTASSPLLPAHGARAEAVFGCPVAESYGMTETSHQAAANPPSTAERRLGSVGLPTGVEFRLRPEAGTGGFELQARGAAVFRCYLRDESQTEAAFTSDGWYRTRDLGRIVDGHIELLGRVDDLINRGGFMVAPLEVERVLCSHPDVAGALVCGVPHEALGEEIAALVVAREGQRPAPATLRRHCAEELAAYKQPGIVKLVNELPRLPNGKPSRALARSLLAG